VKNQISLGLVLREVLPRRNSRELLPAGLGGELVSTKVVRDLFSTTGHRERSHIIREEQQEEKEKEKENW
jgi:hypothetical protein